MSRKPVLEWLNPNISLDTSIYNLQGAELAFFKSQTGIQDDEELKKHILDVQAEAHAVYPYPCIRRLAFTTLKISKYASYGAVLKIGREKPDAILLDLGCCFGNDTRKVIDDGYPLKNVVASDIQPAFWSLGHKLFGSTQESFPVKFIQGNIFDPNFLAPKEPPVPSSSIPPSPPPALAAVTSLTPLQHHISVIHASAFFHLFHTEKEQHDLAHRLGSLLSPVSGSIIFGSHIALPDTEENKTKVTPAGVSTFAHSPSSWEKLWAGDGGVFKPGDVVLSTKVDEVDRRETTNAGGPRDYKAHLLIWSVTRA